MNLIDLVQAVRSENPRALHDLSDKRVSTLVLALLRKVGAQIDAADDGVIAIPGFGRFVVRKRPGADGLLQKRVLFRPAAGRGRATPSPPTAPAPAKKTASKTRTRGARVRINR